MTFIKRPTFEEDERRAHSDLDAAFATMWSHISTVFRPNRQAQPDPSKQPYFLWAKFTNESRNIMVGGEESGVNLNDPMLVIQPCEVVRPINRGDQFERCDTQARYEVTSATVDTTGAWIVNLVRMGVPE